jgi:diacylglycerol kinase family enzyme
MAAVAPTLLVLEQKSRNGWRPAERAERPVLLVNPASGDGRADRAALVGEAGKRAIAVKVLQPGQRLAALVEDAVADGADALGIAGGDGSLAVVATAAHEHDIPFVCIPAGTRNHFALDLGIDRRDLIGSLYTADAARAGIDGEAVELSPPLECVILPGALRVRIPARHPGVSPSGALP